MVEQVIVNADDFGMTPGINRAIIRLHQQGRLNSVSIMVNMPWSDEALAYAREQDDLRTGIHLNVSTGRPLLPVEEVPSLVGQKGEFLPLSALLPLLVAGVVKPDEIERELSAQMEKFLDTHLHFHSLPTLGQVATKLSRRYNTGAVRNPDMTAFVVPPPGNEKPVQAALRHTSRRIVHSTQSVFNRKNIESTKDACGAERLIYLRWCLREGGDPFENFRACLAVLNGQTLEIIAHPAERDDVLPGLSNYVDGRERELKFLSSNRFHEILGVL
jgi:predicted glycoside hydrolase/deacetylase ChbG (UPF0249 family)